MFCSNCGTKLEDGVKFCSGCGTPIGGVNSPSPSAPQHMETSQNNNEEILAKNKVGMSKNNSLTGSAGTGMVTNKRVVFKKISMAKLLVLGPWALLTEGNLDLDLPYSEIKDVRIGKIKFTKAVIITAKDGNEYAFTSQMGPLSDFTQEWYNHIKKFI